MASEGLEQVLIAHRPALERFLRARCGLAADAEDILQDLWLKIGDVAIVPDDALSYLYRMADNLVTDRRRSAARRERRDDEWSQAANGEGEASTEPSAERIVLAKDELTRIAAAFDGLGKRTTAIFKSFRIDGVRQDAIAAAHGISRSAVEKHLQKAYRAVLQLRYKLDAENGETGRLTEEGTEERL